MPASGVGAAMAGLRPIVEFMTWNFAMQAIDQIINSAAKTLYMSGGETRFADRLSVARTVPPPASPPSTARNTRLGMVTAPGSRSSHPIVRADAKGLLKAAIRDPNPVVFLENEILYGQSFEVPKDRRLSCCRSARQKSFGRARYVTIVGFSLMLAARVGGRRCTGRRRYRGRGDRPADHPAAGHRDHRKLGQEDQPSGDSIEEGWPRLFGLGSEMAALIMEHAFDYLDAPVARVTGKDVPMPYAANLEQLALPQTADVIEAAKAVCYR